MRWSWQAALLMLWIGLVSAAVILTGVVPVWFAFLVLAAWLVWYWFNHSDEKP